MLDLLQRAVSGGSAAPLLAARRAGWVASLAASLVAVQSAIWSDHVPWPLKLSVVGVGLLAARRPDDALLILVGLVPFGYVLVTSIWNAHPFSLSEAWVLAFFAGYLWWHRREVFQAAAPVDSLAVPSWLFALVVLASCAVQLAVLQTLHDDPMPYAANFVKYMFSGYLTIVLDWRNWVDGRSFVHTAAMLIEGVALLRCASSLCRGRPALARRLTTMVVVAGAGAALLSFYEPLAQSLSTGQPVASLLYRRRGSLAIPSIDTAGTYFMFVAFLAVATAATSRAHVLPALLACVISIGAMWVAQARTAIVAGLATLAAVVVWIAAARGLKLRPSRAALFACAVAGAASVLLVVYQPLHVFASGVNRWPATMSLQYRGLLSQTAVRMLASSPLFGVGVGQYEQNYGRFSPPELLAVHPITNAHNYLLWVGAELGLIGIGFLLWILGASLVRVWSQTRARFDYWLVGVLAGVAAFMLTLLVGQPLEIPQVGYTFWIVLGAIAGYSCQSDPSVNSSRPRRPLARIAVAAAVVLVVASVPVRARRSISNIDLSRVSYGFYSWDTTNETPRLIKPAPLRGRFRWTGPQATFFLKSTVKAIDLPLTASLDAVPAGVRVDIEVNRGAARHILLNDGTWHIVRLDAPASTARYWRVDLRVAPTWIPRVVIPGNTDGRELGVAVGEISVFPPPPES